MGKLHNTSPDTNDSQWDLIYKIAALIEAQGGGGGGPVTIADGADVAEGAVADAIVAAGATGTVSAKLRRVTQGLEDLKSLIVLAAGSNSIGGTKDNGPHWTSSFGVSSAAVVSADITTATAVTDAPTSGQKIVVTDIIVSTDTAMNILFECETTGVDIFKVFVPANGTVQITPRSKVKLATADKKLTAKSSVAGNVGITVCYYSEA